MTHPFIISPWEEIVSPEGLDGADGTHRISPGDGRTDLQMVSEWISSANGEPSFRARRSCAEKLLNWAYAVRAKPLSSLDWGDFNAFFLFLGRPEPRDAWCCARRTLRSSPEWRPLWAPVTPHYRKQLSRQLSSLSNYLRTARYAALDFSHSMRKSQIVPLAVELAHVRGQGATAVDAFPESLWSSVDAAAEYLPCQVRLSVYLLYFCGLTAVEVSQLTGAAFIRKKGSALPSWVEVSRGSTSVRLQLSSELRRLVAGEARAHGGWAAFSQVQQVVARQPSAVLAAVARVLQRAAAQARLREDEVLAAELERHTPISLRMRGMAHQASISADGTYMSAVRAYAPYWGLASERSPRGCR